MVFCNSNELRAYSENCASEPECGSIDIDISTQTGTEQPEESEKSRDPLTLAEMAKSLANKLKVGGMCVVTDGPGPVLVAVKNPAEILQALQAQAQANACDPPPSGSGTGCCETSRGSASDNANDNDSTSASASVSVYSFDLEGGALAPADIVDTSGAGDSFAGCFLAKYLLSDFSLPRTDSSDSDSSNIGFLDPAGLRVRVSACVRAGERCSRATLLSRGIANNL